ncbi:MAG: hypothetical protein N3D18_08040 [Roseococcus sp.]|nr:hypothetical protein [Roseococcus sp.]
MPERILPGDEHPALLSDEVARAFIAAGAVEGRAQADLDLPVDVSMAARAARAARPRELGGRQAPRALGRGDHGGQEAAEVRRLGHDLRRAHRPGSRLKRSAIEARGAARKSSS